MPCNVMRINDVVRCYTHDQTWAATAVPPPTCALEKWSGVPVLPVDATISQSAPNSSQVRRSSAAASPVVDPPKRTADPLRARRQLERHFSASREKVQREQWADDLLAAFQRHCERAVIQGEWKPGDGQDHRLERAALRNVIRARLLALPDKPIECSSSAATSTTLDNPNELNRLRSALQEAQTERDELKGALGMLDQELMDCSTQLVEFDGDQGFESVSTHLAAILIELKQFRAAPSSAENSAP